jgi:hypothetical protein
MPARPVYTCPCAVCQHAEEDPATAEHHRQMNLLLSRLDEQQRRWYAALEANHLGAGGDEMVAQISGLSVKTIRRGQQDLAASLATRPTERVRLAGGGRPRAEKKTLFSTTS